ncbi:UDP-glucose 4-epimerase GalE [Candidatus Saccharibacteria bacterium]|nr:UDP-glucose 4-epimerase GalE [Candidatus Saccharibacteria bacterium]
MKILITGGTGYIGSHTAIELINQGHDVTIVDNLINSKKTVLEQITKLTGTKPKFYHVDLTNRTATNQIFQENHFDLVIHFAGLKAVAESVEKPLLYYRNNITGTINLLEAMQANQVNNFIFSSSATVYGNPGTPKYTENLPTGQNISSPYGKTKYMIEEIMKDAAASNPNFCAIALRYFNPIGNHPSGLLGENPNGIPNNLMPIITKVYRGQISKLSVYGHDYPTPDGTCRRDYIHVVDLAKGHLAAISVLKPGFEAYNLGTGQPASVLEIIHAFEKISDQPLPHKFAPRRPGDLPEFWADPTKAIKELNWHAKLTIDDAIRDTLTFINQS